MTKRKFEYKPPEEGDLRAYLGHQVMSYLDEHPLAFVEARHMMGAGALSRRVAENLFRGQPNELFQGHPEG